MEEHRLFPYFERATEVAKKSPCSRRQYGAVILGHTHLSITHGEPVAYTGYNERVTDCCNGNICVRDRFKNPNGGRIEQGAEVHAEAAVLLNSGFGRAFLSDRDFVLVGFQNDRELLDTSVYPCHYCAMLIKFCGFTKIYIRNEERKIVPVSIEEILDYRQAEWVNE